MGLENVVADHLSRLVIEIPDVPLNDAFPYEHLLAISLGQAPWFVDIMNYLALGILPHDLLSHQKKKFFHDIKFYI